MEKCKNCGKPLIPYGGKCVYCGSDINDAKKEKRSIIVRDKADFVFCLDCSCSMLNVLDSIKENIAEFMEGIDTMEYESIDWRARVMGYRNFDVDEEYLMNDNPFVTSIDELKKQLDGMKAKGYAENEPCSTLDAIWYAAKKTEWRTYCHKCVLVFTDAQTKPVNRKTCADIISADYSLDVLAQELNVCRVKLFLWGLENPVYDVLMKIPFSNIIQFKDPIDFYYHKILDMSDIYYRPYTTEAAISDDYIL